MQQWEIHQRNWQGGRGTFQLFWLILWFTTFFFILHGDKPENSFCPCSGKDGLCISHSTHGQSGLCSACISVWFPIFGKWSRPSFLTSGGTSVVFLFRGGVGVASGEDSGLPHFLTFPAVVREVPTEAWNLRRGRGFCPGFRCFRSLL